MTTGSEPAAAPSPFVQLLAAGWRPAGVGQWRRGEVVTTAAKAIAALDLEEVAAAALVEIDSDVVAAEAETA